MNSEQFEKFLKKIGGLEGGYRVAPFKHTDPYKYNAFQFLKGMGVKDEKNPFRQRIYSRYFFSFNDGWLEITKKLIEDLVKLGWNKRILQAKEKFGGGRFYIAEGSDEIYNRIHEWEEETFKTCEECGNPGEVRTGGWIRTLCDKCNDCKKS